jgi:hypothetical protein
MSNAVKKLTFDGFLIRTARVNEAAILVHTLDKGFRENKKRQKSKISPLSCAVTPIGFKPITF